MRDCARLGHFDTALECFPDPHFEISLFCVAAKCALSNDIKDYHFVSQGKVSVESIDDKEDMLFADEAFDILGFTKEEKYNVYKMTAVVMHLGELKFKAKSSKDEQAVADESEAIARVAKLIGTDKDWLYENFEHPKIKVRSIRSHLAFTFVYLIQLLPFCKGRVRVGHQATNCRPSKQRRGRHCEGDIRTPVPLPRPKMQ